MKEKMLPYLFHLNDDFLKVGLSQDCPVSLISLGVSWTGSQGSVVTNRGFGLHFMPMTFCWCLQAKTWVDGLRVSPAKSEAIVSN